MWTKPREGDGEEEVVVEDNGTLLSWDAVLPYELLQKVLCFLPIADIIKSSIVCKRWYDVVHSCPPMSWAMMAPQKPLFFRPCSNNSSFSGCVYDPCSLRWYNSDLPLLEKGIWRTSSSCGLVCLMDPNDGSRLFVGNPIKRDWKQLPQLPAGSFSHFNAIALSVDRRTRGYIVVVAKCARTHQFPAKFGQWNLSVHMYKSTTDSWTTPIARYLDLWTGSNEVVICDGVLYYFISRPGMRPHLMTFDLTKPSLLQDSIPAPDSLACAGLINLSNKLVMVGTKGNGQHGGVVILELEYMTWREVTQLPFSVCSKNFICCGTGDFLFVCSSMYPSLLTFDTRRKVWKWSNHPYAEQLSKPESVFYHGFCFEPRLDVSS